MLEIDGSHGEGGGQMLRTALVWSLLTQTPFRMTNIRAGREKPGLKAQHLHVLKSLLLLGPVSFGTAREGSTEIEFHPAPLARNEGIVNLGTAGSITLLLQTLLPAALLAKGASRIEVVGGTDVIWSPPVDYLREIVLEDRAQLHLRRRGFYPRGGGRVVLETGAWTPRPIERVTRGELQRLRVLSVASRELEERQVAERQAEAAEQRLRRNDVPITLDATYVQTASIGSVVTCIAEFENARLGGDALGERGKRAEEVGREAADALGAEIRTGAAVDEHAADQLVVWLALGGGAYRASRITDHTTTNVWVTEQFLGPVVRIEDTTVRCDRPFAL